MASISLYPALVDNYTPAFIGSVCKLNFSLSIFNLDSDFESVHITISKQNNGENIINDTNNIEQERYRANKILILNKDKITTETDGTYSVNILSEDVQGGWAIGEIYKIQIRLSAIEFPSSSIDSQAAWLSQNAGEFSEWSTVCVTKYLGNIRITSKLDGVSSYSSSSLDFYGSFICDDPSENLYSYSLKLYDLNGVLLDSTSKVMNVLEHSNEFFYTFKYELINSLSYKVVLEYQTINRYENKIEYSFNVSLEEEGECDISLTIIDKENNGENGRIGLKLLTSTDIPQGSLYRIKRTDSKSNFTIWEELKILNFKSSYSKEKVNDYIIYDYTIESGIFYQYGIQKINGDIPTKLNKNNNLAIQEFESSFLVGGGRQLKVPFNQNMSSYKYNVSDSNLETIGGKYPFIGRNGRMKYRNFPLNGLISFQMDENELFTSKGKLYQYNNIIEKYKDYNLSHNINNHMDYIYEKFFREEVLDFLQNGEAKLYKSPTEGNIIIRLVDVSLTPNQTLNRMVSEFSSNAYEIADFTLENCIKYNFQSKEEVIQ